MTDPVNVPIGGLYGFGKDVFRWVRGRHLTPEKKIELRQKWKPIFQDAVAERRRDGYGRDVIIRNVKRVDEYPDGDKAKRGFSAWFKVALLDTYNRGIIVGLQIWGLVYDEKHNQYRIADYLSGEEAEFKGWSGAYIPFENIEQPDWSGDEYYGNPQIYCHFNGRLGPYERMIFFQERPTSEQFTYFQELADYMPVWKLSKRIWRKNQIRRKLGLKPRFS